MSTTHCKLEDKKATIIYSFNKQDKAFKTENVPIEVRVYSKSTNTTENYNPEGFGIRFYSPNNRNWIEIPVRDYQIYDVPNGELYYPGENYKGISWWGCNKDDFNRNPDGSLNGPGINTATFSLISSLKCPTVSQNQAKVKCYLEVKYAGQIIFTDSGDCPVKYAVACGEECPPGTTKCASTNYPGYCCLPCNEIAGEIKAIANQVRRINNG